jgi:hypothetical protein
MLYAARGVRGGFAGAALDGPKVKTARKTCLCDSFAQLDELGGGQRSGVSRGGRAFLSLRGEAVGVLYYADRPQDADVEKNAN